MLVHGFSMKICYQETYVITLKKWVIYNVMFQDELKDFTSTGFRLKTTKFSALIIMNLINLWQRIFSISSACLIEILMRTELIEASINTFSFSFLEITTGLSNNSLLVLFFQKKTLFNVPLFIFNKIYLTSTSGLLCLSTTWEEKFSKHIAASSVLLTADK